MFLFLNNDILQVKLYYLKNVDIKNAPSFAQKTSHKTKEKAMIDKSWL